jgi:ribosomal protein S13
MRMACLILIETGEKRVQLGLLKHRLGLKVRGQPTR